MNRKLQIADAMATDVTGNVAVMPRLTNACEDLAVSAAIHFGSMVALNSTRSIEILLVEDSPGDARLTIEAMRDAKVHNRIHVVEDGVEALEFLRRRGRFGDVPRMDLILLDLELPRKNGREVLAELKADHVLRHIPVAVFTTSQAEEDMLRACDLQANYYVTKPLDLEQFMNIVSQIDQFCINVVKFPKR